MSKTIDRLGEHFDGLLQEAVVNFCDRMKQQASVPLRRRCLFYPSSGIEQGAVGMMLIGQAPNGWKPEFEIEANDERALVQEARTWSNTMDEGECTPLDWVNKLWGKHMFRSFFWQVGYKVVNGYKELPKESEDWCKHMVWSNLMKIAPTRWNPNEEEKAAHLKEAIALFRHEVEAFTPRFVVLLTNWETWAKPFLNEWAEPLPMALDEHGRIQWVGIWGGTTFIVTKRPHQSSGDYASAPYVEAILGVMGRVDKGI